MHPQFIKQYYMKEGILDKLFELCKEREVVPVFKDKFGKRPSSIQFKGDLSYLVKNNATSFHASVEHWKNVSTLSSDLRRQQLDDIRTSWDLIFDIDSDKGIDYAKKAAILMVQALKIHGVKNISIKFSGRRGWHIGISHKSFPEIVNKDNIKNQFPELAQQIASYLRDKIKDKLMEQFIKIDSSLKKEKDPYKFVDIEQNWGSRHLFRLPYSLNEKTWLVSVPIELYKIAGFKLEDAKLENVKPNLGFLDKWEKNEAKDLIMETLDWNAKQMEKDVVAVKRDYSVPTKAIPEGLFPPCVKNILQGIKDGRKRSIFILINFLRTCGWEWNEIESRLLEWNKKNPDPIREVYLTTQLNYAKKKNKRVLPPNCDNKGYYSDIAICKKDSLCERIKNPTSYALRRARPERRKR